MVAKRGQSKASLKMKIKGNRWKREKTSPGSYAYLIYLLGH